MRIEISVPLCSVARGQVQSDAVDQSLNTRVWMAPNENASRKQLSTAEIAWRYRFLWLHDASAINKGRVLETEAFALHMNLLL